jgi:hypothetical protein
MGIFAQSNDAIKWCWFEYDSNNEIQYNDIFIYPLDNNVRTNIKVIKKGDEFILYKNGQYYSKRKISKLYDYFDSMIYIGVGNPYSDTDSYWFNGEIYYVKIYHDSVESDENLYLWLDFKRNTQFKTFDISGNGNHGEIYETDEFKEMKNIEFNKTARPAKII